MPDSFAAEIVDLSHSLLKLLNLDLPYRWTINHRLLFFLAFAILLSYSSSNRVGIQDYEFPEVKEDDQESVVMLNKNGQNSICYMPKVEEAKSGKPILQQNTSSMIVETEKRVKKKTPDELLEILKDQCFIRQEGWWSYEFCYQKRLRQIHLEDEKIIPSGESMADHCNVLPKDYKETQVEDEESEIKQIVMVTDGESHSNDDSDE